MNDSVRRARAAWTRVFARTSTAASVPVVDEHDPDETVDARFDTAGLELLEDGQGFDPYAHARLPTRRRAPQPKTDLRALSAQILAERARNKQPD